MRFHWITDVPTPYRNHAFETMHRIFHHYGIEFEVQFVSWRDDRRPWNYAAEDLHFPFRRFGGVHPRLRGIPMHLNPGLLLESALSEADVTMVGGYSSPSHVMLPFILPARTIRLLGCESNLESVGRRDAIANTVKRAIVGRYDGFLVPGPRSRELIEALHPKASGAPFVTFPNIIDKTAYRTRVSELRRDRSEIRASFGLEMSRPFWFVPARPSPEKGVKEFLALVDRLKGVQILVAGEGPDRQELERFASDRALPVRFLGNQSETNMLRLYAAADVVVIPSLRDASPLAAVECCAASLPLVASERIGNLNDVLSEGVNGWIYRPGQDDLNVEMLNRIADAPLAQLEEMGRASGRRYDTQFDSDLCVSRLAEQLVELPAVLRRTR